MLCFLCLQLYSSGSQDGRCWVALAKLMLVKNSGSETCVNSSGSHGPEQVRGHYHSTCQAIALGHPFIIASAQVSEHILFSHPRSIHEGTTPDYPILPNHNSCLSALSLSLCLSLIDLSCDFLPSEADAGHPFFSQAQLSATPAHQSWQFSLDHAASQCALHIMPGPLTFFGVSSSVFSSKETLQASNLFICSCCSATIMFEEGPDSVPQRASEAS